MIEKDINVEKGGTMEHFSLSLFGYNRQQVNQKIDNFQERIHELEKEIEKLQMDHDKLETEVEQYRHMEEALQKGIVDARVTGNKIIDDSSVEADRILQKTHEQISQYKEDFAFHSRELAYSGSELKDNLKIMKSEFQQILDSYQDMLDKTDFDTIYPRKHIERVLLQVSAYEEEDLGLLEQRDKADHIVKNQAITEEEKIELEQLINEVITNEAKDLTSDSDKFIDFTKIKNTQEG